MSETRKLKEQEFRCEACGTVGEEQVPFLILKSRKEAMLHNKKTGHRVTGEVTYEYDYPAFEIPPTEKAVKGEKEAEPECSGDDCKI